MSFENIGDVDARSAMSKKFTLCLLLIMFVITSSLAFADSISPYFGVTVGTALTSVNKLSDSSGSLNTDFDPGYMAGLTAGVTFDSMRGWNIERIRAEAEIAYRSSGLVRMKNLQGQSADMSGTVSVTNFMLNGYLENTSLLPNNIPAILFLTVGAGAAHASISSISYQGTTLVKSASDTQLAYQAGFGVGYELTKNTTLDASYKYMGTTTFNFAGIKAEYGSHNILLGARYAFK
jgi:opacity protein-like surface antigen